MKTFALSAAVLAGIALARGDDPTTHEKLAERGLTFEEYRIKNEKGYICKAFRLTGSEETGAFPMDKPSVIFQHGMGGNSVQWLVNLNDGDPMAIQLAKRGFDVWLSNTSGNEECEEHESLTIDDPEFWNIGLVDYGYYDTPALIEEIKKHNGGRKVGYVGNSQGTTQAFVGLANRPDYYDENVSAMAMLGPCHLFSDKYFAIYTKENWDWLYANDIYVLSGPEWNDWQRDFVIANAPQSLVDNLALFDSLRNNPLPVAAHFAQIGKTQRFQEYIPDWFDTDHHRSHLMDVGMAQETKLALYVGLFDDTCPGKFARNLKDSLGNMVSHYVVYPWQGHVPWFASNRKWLIDDLEKVLLSNQGDDDYPAYTQ